MNKTIPPKKKILIVDDERMITYLLSKRLDASGYETFNAQDGESCLTLATKIKPDIILLDIVMPHGDGFYTFEKLRKNNVTKSIPIIFITAYDDEAKKRKIKELKPEACFIKPFDGEKLLDKIIELIGN